MRSSTSGTLSKSDLFLSTFGFAVVVSAFDDGTKRLVNVSLDVGSVDVDASDEAVGSSADGFSGEGNAFSIPLESSDCTCRTNYEYVYF